VTPRLLSLAAALLALWPLAGTAQETPRSPREDRVMKALIGLPHSRHLDTLKELGITPEGGFLDCLCRSAGYGSSTTAQFYHPDTIGEYNKMYSCSQPGEPCVVSGFGCMRYPMPSDPAIWDSCGREFPGEGGGNLIDKMLKEISKRGDKPAANYRAELAQCRGNWSAGLGGNPVQDWQDGLKYLGNAGAPLLPPPPKLAAKMKAEAQVERSKLADKVKAATAKAETGLEEAGGRQDLCRRDPEPRHLRRRRLAGDRAGKPGTDRAGREVPRPHGGLEEAGGLGAGARRDEVRA
jgi:hypothetical protein